MCNKQMTNFNIISGIINRTSQIKNRKTGNERADFITFSDTKCYFLQLLTFLR